jgi:hypothetical protein
MKPNAYTDFLAGIALAIALLSAVQLMPVGQTDPQIQQDARLAAAGWEEAEIGG